MPRASSLGSGSTPLASYWTSLLETVMRTWVPIAHYDCQPGDLILWLDGNRVENEQRRMIHTEPELIHNGFVKYTCTTGGTIDVDSSMPWDDLKRWLVRNNNRTRVFRRKGTWKST